MEVKISNIAKNTSYFTLALVIQKIISFFYFAVIARNLMPDDLGRYYFAISFTTIFAIFIDLGLSNVLTREIPKIKDDKAAAGKILSTALSLKLPLAALSALSVIALVNLMGYPELTRTLVYLSCFSMILDSFTTSFFAALRGFHNLKYESVGSVLFQLIALAGGLFVLKNGWGLPFLMGAMILASSFNFVFSGALLIAKLKLPIALRFRAEDFKALALLTAPFALYAILQRFYMYFDTVLLSKLASDYFVGLYQVPFKIVFALQFLPLAFVASLYPAFSAYWKSNREQLSVSFTRSLNYLTIISLPISAGVFVLADKILLLFKPEYLAAALPLRIIIAALFFIFLNFPIGSLLNACDRQKTNTRNMAIALVASIALNLILITKWQAVGASITVLLTNALMFFLGLRVVPEIIRLDYKKTTAIFFKTLFSALIMAALIWLLKDRFSVFILIFIGALTYALMVFALKAVRKEDLRSVIASISAR